MHALAKLTRLEAKVLLLRDPVLLLVALALAISVGVLAIGAAFLGMAMPVSSGEASVKTHPLRVSAKLDVNDRAAAVAAAYERGLPTPGGNPD